MKKHFCNYKQSLALKELGFYYPCIATYTEGAIGKGDELQWFVTPQEDVNNDFTFVAAPLKSQVFEWFREYYGYWSYIKEATKGTCRFYVEKFDEKFFNSDIIDCYEEAELACIDKLIEILKNNLNK